MLPLAMADLEELAIKRDRGYLVRLILGLGVGAVVSVFLWKGLTGEHVTGCVTGVFLGQDGAGGAPKANSEPAPR